MRRVARFEKVSLKQFAADFECLSDITAADCYEGIKKPLRATRGSAGYDFFAPYDIELKPGEALKVPTGWRCRMRRDFVLMIFPRSGLGFKYRLQLNNSVGIIDSDYYGAPNEGHIMIKIFNDGREGKTVTLPRGTAFAQGIFLPFGITTDDCVRTERTGGLGSTSSTP